MKLSGIQFIDKNTEGNPTVILKVRLVNGDIFRIEEGKDGKLLITPVEEENVTK